MPQFSIKEDLSGSFEDYSKIANILQQHLNIVPEFSTWEESNTNRFEHQEYIFWLSSDKKLGLRCETHEYMNGMMSSIILIDSNKTKIVEIVDSNSHSAADIKMVYNYSKNNEVFSFWIAGGDDLSFPTKDNFFTWIFAQDFSETGKWYVINNNAMNKITIYSPEGSVQQELKIEQQTTSGNFEKYILIPFPAFIENSTCKGLYFVLSKPQNTFVADSLILSDDKLYLQWPCMGNSIVDTDRNTLTFAYEIEAGDD